MCRVSPASSLFKWGDGSPDDRVEVIASVNGVGDVTASHRYLDDGTYPSMLCITDDAGDTTCDTTCDSISVTLRTTNGVLDTDGEPDDEVFEGDLVSRQVAFSDANPTDTHTGSISWGDGVSGPMDVQDGGAVGVGSAVHRYGDNGAYSVVGAICDDRGLCSSARSSITVLNVAPTLTAAGSESVRANEVWSLTGTWADAGIDNTHVVTVDWGDGTTSQVSPSVLKPGSGEFAATHQYASAGTCDVSVCVVDDDEASSCTELLAEIAAAPTNPTSPGATTTTLKPTGTDPSVTPISSRSTVTPYVKPSAAAATALPRTGSSLRLPVIVGLLLSAGGAVLVIADRRIIRGRRNQPG